MMVTEDMWKRYKAARAAGLSVRSAVVMAQGTKRDTPIKIEWGRDRLGETFTVTVPDLVKASFAEIGFDPAFVTLAGRIEQDEWFDSMQDMVEGAGFKLVAFDAEEVREKYAREWRPSHRASEEVRVMRRGTYGKHYYVDCPRDLFAASGPPGEARGVKAERMQRQAREGCEAWAKSLDQRASGDISPYCVDLYAFWRGEEIARVSIGGVELQVGTPTAETEAQVEELLYELRREMVRWAQGASDELVAEIDAVTAKLKNLPEAAWRA